jgi:ribosomal protein S3AE
MTALTTAEQKEIRAMVLEMIARGAGESTVRESMKKAVLLFRELKVDSAGPAKATR